jgi:KamA family protein
MTKRYTAYTRRNYRKLPQTDHLDQEALNAIDVVSHVLPFKTNNYVVNELIDWKAWQEDPMFILNFPNKEMLHKEQFNKLSELIRNGASKRDLLKMVNDIRLHLNPHPAGQLEHNVPTLNGEKLLGVQHKYRETMLFFPSQGQTCHAYCTFCFRWPQFTGMDELKFAMKQSDLMVKYLRENEEITDILFTGGDPMVMKAGILKRYIDAILKADLKHIKTIRIGTKSLSFWPYRYITDSDSREILDLFKKVTDAGKHIALMAHFNHHRELGTAALQEAVENIRNTGAQIRTQSPVLQHINDSAETWATMWRKQVALGMVPYYMFVARDTGAQSYFGLSLDQAYEIFRQAYTTVSGICRTVRGPSMSTGPGKVQILGVSEVHGEKVYVLNFIQGRDPEWVGKPFFAQYDKNAMWLDDLEPAFGAKEFFYEKGYRKLIKVEKIPGHTIGSSNLQSA